MKYLIDFYDGEGYKELEKTGRTPVYIAARPAIEDSRSFLDKLQVYFGLGSWGPLFGFGKEREQEVAG